MKILLTGQKRFGRDVLHLIEGMGHTVVAVCAPGQDVGGFAEDKLHFSAAYSGCRLIPAGTLRAETVPEGTDLIIAAHSHDFVGRKTRLRARLGAIGYHPSLLPLHRGRDAIAWTIKMRERVAGGSVYWLNDTVDGGPIAAQDWCFVRPEDDARELWSRELAPMGLHLFERVLRDLAAGTEVRVKQDHSLATWEPACSGQPRLFRPELELLTS